MAIKEIEGGGNGLGSSGSGLSPVAGCCYHINEPLFSVKGGKFFTSFLEKATP
jgi:hypothetical protein